MHGAPAENSDLDDRREFCRTNRNGEVIALILILGWACGCNSGKQFHPLPAQVVAISDQDPGGLPRRVSFGDTDANDYIVDGINGGDAFRWTREHPQVRLLRPAGPDCTFYMKFRLAERTMEDTGPVTIQVKMNGRQFKSYRYEAAGVYLIEDPCPVSEESIPGPTLIEAGSTPMWTSPDDGAKLGYLIQEIGYR